MAWQGQGMMKVKSLERSASGRGWFNKQDRGQSRGDRGDQAQLQQQLQEKDATIEALQARNSLQVAGLTCGLSCNEV